MMSCGFKSTKTASTCSKSVLQPDNVYFGKRQMEDFPLCNGHYSEDVPRGIGHMLSTMLQTAPQFRSNTLEGSLRKNGFEASCLCMDHGLAKQCFHQCRTSLLGSRTIPNMSSLFRIDQTIVDPEITWLADCLDCCQTFCISDQPAGGNQRSSHVPIVRSPVMKDESAVANLAQRLVAANHELSLHSQQQVCMQHLQSLQCLQSLQKNH